MKERIKKAAILGAMALTVLFMTSSLLAASDNPYGTVSGETAPSGNLALGKPATQSSTDYEGEAGRAVDGITNGAWAAGSVTHTKDEAQPWWQVDLGGSQPIEKILLWNRTDCCSDRVSNYYVLVSDAPIESPLLAEALEQPGVSSFYQPGRAGNPSTVSVGGTGRYVRIQLVGPGALNIAEVQVVPSS
ncbi:discoidin domain-containing protein [Paenibacillus flagellatus]|uniref:F5/8 type C domain-containing protein n=1 Tax=Paenibacillus flagellatus TaxID=2211139 RepID=A0A2V5JXN5_9BACL|nr:discoidin domain-containing protein [Paenibacillus flagellatus]PYI51568.1 hypothetical protein DLM86_24445 [Paenibacillus flagellatus]